MIESVLKGERELCGGVYLIGRVCALGRERESVCVFDRESLRVRERECVCVLIGRVCA